MYVEVFSGRLMDGGSKFVRKSGKCEHEHARLLSRFKSHAQQRRIIYFGENFNENCFVRAKTRPRGSMSACNSTQGYF